MNERIVPGMAQPETPGKLAHLRVPLPARTTPPSAKKYLLVGATLVLLLVAAAVAWLMLGSTGTVQYITAPVTRGAVTRAVTATGTVNPELTIIVGTYVSGVIKELYCDYNTQVKKGQVCAKIDPRPYQSIVDQNRANLAVAKAQLAKDKAILVYTKLAYDRAVQLVKTNAVSQDAVDSARSTYDQAVAQVEFDEATIQERQAALDAAQVNLDYTDIVSPVDGTVVSRNVTMGQTVAASFQTPTLFLIATDLTRMEVDTNVSESDIGGIKTGNKATFTVDAYAKRTFDGTVSQVRESPQTVQNIVTYDVVVSAGNSDLALMPGLTADSRIVVAQRDDVIRVPNQALRYAPGGAAGTNEPGQSQIWILRNDQPVAVPVVLGLEDDSYTEIVSGDVKPGDRVITAEQVATTGRATAPRLRL